MTKIAQIIVDAILVVAVVVLFVLHFGAGKSEVAPVAEVAEGNMPIAYVNLDSILLGYDFAIEASDKLMAKQEDARAKLNAKMRTLQQEAADFQRKIDNNAFLSRERVESETAKLQRKQAELEDLEQKLTQEIMLENQKLILQLADSLQGYLAELNSDHRFHLIMANTGKDNILQSNEGYDITAEVVSGLNARYKK